MTARKKPDEGLYVASTTGVVRIGGRIYRYTRGKTIVKHTDPILRAIPDSFRLLDVSGPEVVAL